MSADMHPSVPILRSFDEKATREFYLEFLGFEIEFEHRFEADLPLYMSVRCGNCVIHLSEHHGDATPGGALRIQVNDVHALARDLNEKRYKFARPGVQRQDWGDDEMIVKDPSGNRLVFYTPV